MEQSRQLLTPRSASGFKGLEGEEAKEKDINIKAIENPVTTIDISKMKEQIKKLFGILRNGMIMLNCKTQWYRG